MVETRMPGQLRACTPPTEDEIVFMSFEQLKQEVALLDDRQQAEVITYALQLRYAHDAGWRREVTDRLNDADSSHWLTPGEFERRLDNH